MFYQINFLGAMTCDDDALLKDGAIQKEMKLEIKPAFCDFEALFKMFIEAWLVWFSWLEHHSVHKKMSGSISHSGHIPRLR